MMIFTGADYCKKRDYKRLKLQLERIFYLMNKGKWRTLSEIGTLVNASTASVSAQLRNLRKPSFGGFTVERKHIENGLYKYRLLEGE